MLRLARHAHDKTGMKNLCLAGGVALNCVANGRLLREGPFERIWVQPAAGDAGGAVGAALLAWYDARGQAARSRRQGRDVRRPTSAPNSPTTSSKRSCTAEGVPYHPLDDRARATAKLLADGGVVGWFQGRMEFGPRALGARSILGDARSPSMQSKMNLKIKFRESFRPFAPSVLREQSVRLLRPRRRLAVHAAHRAGACVITPRRDRRRARQVGHRAAQRAALDDSRRSRTSTTRRACRR